MNPIAVLKESSGARPRAWFALMMCACAVLAMPGQASAQVVEKTLANGLKILIKEDHRAPTVVHMAWYKAGTLDEFNGRTGVAHVLEHMMFKGTKTHAAGE